MDGRNDHCPGQSELTETIFENRFMHVPAYLHGAQCQRPNCCRQWRVNLSATVMATDLRASALVLAGLAATSQTLSSGHQLTVYDGLVDKLRGVGAVLVDLLITLMFKGSL